MSEIYTIVKQVVLVISNLNTHYRCTVRLVFTFIFSQKIKSNFIMNVLTALDNSIDIKGLTNTLY